MLFNLENVYSRAALHLLGQQLNFPSLLFKCLVFEPEILENCSGCCNLTKKNTQVKARKNII